MSEQTSVPDDAADEAYYFGTWQRAGHYFFRPGMRSLPRSRGVWWAETPWKNEVDGRLTPGKRNRSGRLDYEAMAPAQQGKAALHHKGGWTALAIHDFTVDGRPGSNSVFFFRGDLDFPEALSTAHEYFPEVLRRIGSVALVETHSETAHSGQPSPPPNVHNGPEASA